MRHPASMKRMLIRIMESMESKRTHRVLLLGTFHSTLSDIRSQECCAGIANIGREYTTQKNPRLVLHDSQGFEAGSADSWNGGWWRRSCASRIGWGTKYMPSCIYPPVNSTRGLTILYERHCTEPVRGRKVTIQSRREECDINLNVSSLSLSD